MRPFLFHAFFSISNERGDTLSVIIEDVFLQSSDQHICNCGVDFDEFQEELAAKGWRYDSNEAIVHKILNPEVKIPLKNGEISDFEDFIHFTGIPLQYSGLNDKLGKAIYEKHNIGGAVVAWCNETAQFGLKYPKQEKLIPLFMRNKDFFTEGYDLDLTPDYHE